MKNINKKSITWLCLLLSCTLFIVTGCKKEFNLQEDPKDQLSEATFWNTKNDALKALTACYRGEDWTGWWNSFDGWNIVGIKFEGWTDILSNKEFGSGFPQAGIVATDPQVHDLWSSSYGRIAKVNYFLENIGKVQMDQTEKAQMVAEVKFIRAYSYFWLSQLYGNVPLVQKTLTFGEANSIKQAKKEEVVNFALNDLKEAVQDLPVNRPAPEKGRIEKGAALTLMGRFLMAEKRWADASATYKQIIDLNRYIIDPRFKELFQTAGDNSDEIIFSRKYMQDMDGEPFTQLAAVPGWYGGYSQFSFFQNFVDKFLMIDGKPTDQSALYSASNPFANRDPRLYATVLLPGYSVINNKRYVGNPDSSSQNGPGVTGYGLNKFYDPGYTGNKNSYGGDYKLMRYAEVLLSYLESELEAGHAVTPTLLNQTINKVRDRNAVRMAHVTETSPTLLREIIRNERAVELACEGGIRYWDLIRWKTAAQSLNRKFYGMQVTDNPQGYTGKYIINSTGNIFIQQRIFNDWNYLWPIPQSELDVNPNLVQNPGYN